MAIDNLTKIKIRPLAAESFGVRSMCTLVETPDFSILLDAGISLTPYRFNLPPHPIEFQTINRLRQVIAKAANKTAVTSISHYHFDHHTPSFEDWVVNWTEDGKTARQIYCDKTVFVKNPKENINASQRQRASTFRRTGGKYAKEIVSADGKTFEYGNTKLYFSEAVVHGPEDQTLGWVIMTNVEYDNEKFMFAPDVQGPISKHTTDLILSAKPNVIMLGGPPLYLGAFRVDTAKIEQGLNNLGKVVEETQYVIIEHHILRDESWRCKMAKVFQQSSAAGHSIMTAAEYAGKENNFLETKRKQLYQDNPPDNEFKQWMKTLNNKNISKPPI
jgi:uncharacterized protein